MISRRTLLFGSITGAGALYHIPQHRLVAAAQIITGPASPPLPQDGLRQITPWAKNLIAAAETQIGKTVSYDPSYVKLEFPFGDIPIEKGVCSDVVIRAYRTAFKLDLQSLINQDMKRAFNAYPKIWGLKRPDKNIDHRRVPNMERYFERRNANLKVTDNNTDYLPGDLVTHRLPGNLPHIAVVSNRIAPNGTRPLIIHNIGAGTRLEDALFRFKINGHYRFSPDLA